MASSSLDAIAIVLDISMTMDQAVPGNISPLDESRNILSVFLQRKIFEESKDHVCFFTCGSEHTSNELTSGDDYLHISLERPLDQVDWELCNLIQNDVTASDQEGDIIDALIVASTYLMKATLDNAKKAKQFAAGRKIIMLLTNVDSPITASKSELEQIIAGFKDKDIDLHVIGLSTDEGSDEARSPGDPGEGTSSGPRSAPPRTKPKTSNQLRGETIMKQIVEELDGAAYSFRDAMTAMTHYAVKKKNSAAWNADLVIGPTLKLPISGYKMVTRDPPPTFKPCLARNIYQDVDKKVDFSMADGSDTVVSNEDVIKGYRYGTDLVPFTEDDMNNMKYKCPEKSFQVIGFTKKTNIKRSQYQGTGTMVMVSRKDDDVAAVGLSAFIKALYETDMVAIVRRAYQKNSTPVVGALIPGIEASSELLYYVELPFMEDIRDYEFPPLPLYDEKSKHKPTTDQLNAIDQLITDMGLVDESGEEQLDPKEIHNPTMQRLFQVLQSRADSEDEPLPDVPPILIAMMNVSAEIRAKSQQSLSTVQNLFKLEVIAKDKSKDNEFKDSDIVQDSAMADGTTETRNGAGDANVLKSINQVETTDIGTADPVADFNAMISQSDDSAQKACQRMQEVICTLLVDSVGDVLYNKALNSLKAYRQHAISGFTKEFNAFMAELKVFLLNKGLIGFWETLMSDDMNLIDCSEDPTSGASADMCLAFMNSFNINNSQPANITADDDLLDMI